MEREESTKPDWEAAIWAVGIIGVLAAVAYFLLGPSLTKPEVAQCEDRIKAHLKAPSTYERINSFDVMYEQKDVDELNKSLKEIDETYVSRYPKAPFFIVNIEYDAANPMGVPIRSKVDCYFGVKNGKLDAENYLGNYIMQRCL